MLLSYCLCVINMFNMLLFRPKKLYSNLPRVAVEESILKDVDTRQVESVDNDLFDELFGALDR